MINYNLNYDNQAVRVLNSDSGMNRKNARLIACLKAATELYFFNPTTAEVEETIEESGRRMAKMAVEMEKILAGEKAE